MIIILCSFSGYNGLFYMDKPGSQGKTPEVWFPEISSERLVHCDTL